MIKRSFLAALWLGMLLAAPAWAQQKVTIYSAAPQDLIDHVVPAFEKASGIKVELIKGGSGDLINRMKAEAGRQSADVLFSVSSEVVEANAKLFSKFTPDNARFLGENFKVNDAAVPFTAVARRSASTPSCSRRRSTRAPGPTWPSRSTRARSRPVARTSRARPSSSSRPSCRSTARTRAGSCTPRILDNLVLSNSSGAVSQFVNDGEAQIGISNEDTLLKYKVGGGPVELLYPEDGTSAVADVMALARDAGHSRRGRQGLHRLHRLSKRRRRSWTRWAGVRCAATSSRRARSRRWPRSSRYLGQVRRRLGRRQPHAHPRQVERPAAEQEVTGPQGRSKALARDAQRPGGRLTSPHVEIRNLGKYP